MPPIGYAVLRDHAIHPDDTTTLAIRCSNHGNGALRPRQAALPASRRGV
jgi:hypothetical protein